MIAFYAVLSLVSITAIGSYMLGYRDAERVQENVDALLKPLDDAIRRDG